MTRLLMSLLISALAVLQMAMAQSDPAGKDSLLASCLREARVHFTPQHLTWIFQLSEEDCINCNTAVISEIARQIRTLAHDTDIVVAVSNGTRATLKALSRRLQIPVVACSGVDDTDAFATKKNTPALVAVTASGAVMKRYPNINVTPPDVSSFARPVDAASMPSEQLPARLPLRTRDSNDAIGRIASVQFDSITGILSIVDATANVIRRYDASNGQESSVVEMPDLIKHYFKPAAPDEAWQSIGSLSYDPATFGSIVIRPGGDSLISLISVLSDYRVEKRPLPTNPHDSAAGVSWMKSQIMTLWQHDSLVEIENSLASTGASIVGLARLGNRRLVGTCFWPGTFGKTGKEGQNSASLLVEISSDLKHLRPIVPLSSSSFRAYADEIVPTFIGLISPIDGNRIAYVNQLNQIFGVVDIVDPKGIFHPLPIDSTLRSIFPRTAPRTINRATPFEGLPYIVADIVADISTINILLVPNRTDLDVKILRYSVDGRFLSEELLSNPERITKARFVGFFRGKLGILMFNDKAGWFIRWIATSR